MTREFGDWLDLQATTALAQLYDHPFAEELCRSAWLAGASEDRREVGEWMRAFRAYQNATTDEEQRNAAWWLNDLKNGNGYCHQPPCAVEMQDRTIRELEARVKELGELVEHLAFLLERTYADHGGDDVGCQLD